MSAATAEAPAGIDPTVLAALDFEPEFPCEATPFRHAGPCTATAVWWRTCLVCGDRLAYCEQHRLGFAVAMAQLALRRSMIGCVPCGHVTPAARWPDGFAFLPIGRA